MVANALTAGAMIHQARRKAGLSQVELGRRAGVTQSVISAYESGRRQPSMPTFAGLIEAAGFELVIELRPHARGLSRLTGPVGQRLRSRRPDVVAAAADYGVSGLHVFGSVARGEDGADSDIDLLADLPPGMSLFKLGRLQARLEDILGTHVDLVPARDLKPEVRARVDTEVIAL